MNREQSDGIVGTVVVFALVLWTLGGDLILGMPVLGSLGKRADPLGWFVLTLLGMITISVIALFAWPSSQKEGST